MDLAHLVAAKDFFFRGAEKTVTGYRDRLP